MTIKGETIFVKPYKDIKERELIMDKYRCTVCGYIYDPAAGDSTQGINPQTAFENLPDGWVCPECGVGKEMFVPTQ